MIERSVTIRLKTGLQARPAAQFVQEANKFQSEIFITKDGKKVNAKSIMGVMSLALASGTEIVLSADGKDEQEAIDALANFISKESI